jgi:hypothetical protein
MPGLSPLEFSLLVLAGFCVGMSKGGLGAMAMVAILLFAEILPARESTGAILPVLITADIFALALFRRHFSRGHLIRLLPSAVVGVAIGWWVFPVVPAESFARVIGWISLAMLSLVVVQRVRPELADRVSGHPVTGNLAGVTAGVTTMLANAAGPVTTIYFLACRLPKMQFVGTAVAFYFVINLTKVPFSASLGLITPASLTLNAMLIPAVAAGVFFARWVLGKINQPVFETLMIAFSALGAIRLVMQPG